MKWILYLSIGQFLFAFTVNAQKMVLEDYIKIGIESNAALKQLELDYTESLFALKEAKGLFFPDINLNARYTVADGGRIIAFPVGDLLNPVYNTLNLLTASNQFPEIDNQEFSFYRAKEHETKLSLIQPIYNSDLIANMKIKKEYSEIYRVDIEQYKRELIREIKTAYYTFLKAHFLLSIIDSTSLLVEENLRVSEVLYKNDLVTIDAVYRSESEVSKVLAEKANARVGLYSAKAYFNFLLNRELESPIDIYQETPEALALSLTDFQESALENREEMDLIKKSKSLNNRVLSMQRGSASPDLFATVDYGFQGEEYRFTNEDDFVLASMVLRWNIFQGLTNKNKIQQTKIEGEKLTEILLETEQKINMQVINKYYSAVASYEGVSAARSRVSSSKKAFKLIARKYAEGQASLLEYIDARTNYTNAESKLIMAINDYFISIAELEFAAAEIDLKQY